MRVTTRLWACLLVMLPGVAAASTPPSLEPVIQLGHTQSTLDMALSPDERVLATVAEDGRVVLWDVATGRELRAILTSSPRAVAWSPAGAEVAVGNVSGRVTFYAAETGKHRGTLETDAGTIDALAWGPAGLLVGGEKDPALWDVTARKKVVDLQARSESRRILKFSFDASRRRVVMGRPSGHVAVWDLDERRQILAWQAVSGSEVEAVGLARDGRQILVAHGYGKVSVFDDRGRLLRTFEVEDRASAIVAAADGETFFFGMGRYPIAGGGVRSRLDRDGFHETRMVNRAGDAAFSMSTSGWIMWDTASAQPVRVVAGQVQGPSRLAVSPDGRWLLVASTRSVALWDLTLGREVRRLGAEHLGPWGSCSSVAYSPDGRLAAVGCNSMGKGHLLVYAMPEGTLLHLLAEYGFSVDALGFAADGRTLLSTSQDDVALWDAREGRKLRSVVPSDLLLPDGRRLLSSRGIGRNLTLHDVATGDEVARAYLGGGERDFTLSPDGGHVAGANTSEAVLVWRTADLAEAARIASPPSSSIAFTTDGQQLLVGTFGGEILAFDRADGAQRARLVGHTGSVIDLVAIPGTTQVASAGTDGAVRIWDLATQRELVQLVSFVGGEFIAISGNNYAGSPRAARLTHFVDGMQTWSFENFDHLYNRPDLIVERLGRAEPAVVASYRAARTRRLARQGLREAELGLAFNVPQVTVLTRDIPVKTEQATLELDLEISDATHPLNALQVVVNEVPVFGVAGRPIPGRVRGHRARVSLELTAGTNRIEISATNAKGAESLRTSIVVERVGETPRPRLFVVALGVSDYEDNAFDLAYAAKDATDLADALGANTGFAVVERLVLVDAAVTPAGLKRARTLLMASSAHDHVVVFYAGHGLLDASFGYWLATRRTRFADPARGSLPYDSLPALFDGIPARKRLLLLDACHSGEVDKEEGVTTSTLSASGGRVVSRGFQRTRPTAARVGLSNSFELMRELFADVRRGVGAVVLASAGGAEYALEADEWRNGVFTFSVLEALRGGADLSGDRQVQVSELRSWVYRRVVELTGGRQNPTARAENLAWDFGLGMTGIRDTEAAAGEAEAGQQRLKARDVVYTQHAEAAVRRQAATDLSCDDDALVLVPWGTGGVFHGEQFEAALSVMGCNAIETYLARCQPGEDGSPACTASR